MAKHVPPEELQQALDWVTEHRTAERAVKALGLKMPYGTLHSRAQSALGKGMKPTVKAPPPEAVADPALVETTVQRLERQNRDLRRELVEIQQHNITEEWVRRKIYGLSAVHPSPPQWMVREKKGVGLSGTPALLISDLHWGEWVNPKEIGDINSFDMKIARHRLRLTGEKAVELLKDYSVVPEYPGIVVMLGGDNFSGTLHDLSETNEVTMMAAFCDLQDNMAALLGMLADNFGRVFVTGVVGNHGRTSFKPKTKQRALTNFDWLLYQQLQGYFKGDHRFSWYIPENADAYFKLYSWHIILTHGDQFRGGDGIIGPIGPIVRGTVKKRSKYLQENKPVDFVFVGHWHFPFVIPNFVVANSSLKGADEYGHIGNFAYCAPSQYLVVIHPTMGMIRSEPLYLTENVRPQATNWVSVPGSAK